MTASIAEGERADAEVEEPVVTGGEITSVGADPPERRFASAFDADACAEGEAVAAGLLKTNLQPVISRAARRGRRLRSLIQQQADWTVVRRRNVDVAVIVDVSESAPRLTSGRAKAGPACDVVSAKRTAPPAAAPRLRKS